MRLIFPSLDYYAEAIVLKNLAQGILFLNYKKSSSDSYPVESFKDKEEALAQLETV
ncbi:MAG: hypothetical protein ACI865_003287 [Flavobacteriaceae bacterium]|jgi:hypothetical protein